MFKNKAVSYIIFGVSLAVFLTSATMIVKYFYDGSKVNREFEKLTEITEITEDNTSSDEVISEDDEAISKIQLLQAMNEECIGWITIEDTPVNYPVMHTPDDPEKYLRRDFNNKYSAAGVPFVDARCDLQSPNIIIYGHNMKNRSMFGSLINYLKDEYLKPHPVIKFETMNGCEYYTIVEVRKTDTSDSWYNQSINSTDGNEYLTLSTCRGTVKTDRLLIIAVKNDSE